MTNTISLNKFINALKISLLLIFLHAVLIFWITTSINTHRYGYGLQNINTQLFNVNALSQHTFLQALSLISIISMSLWIALTIGYIIYIVIKRPILNINFFITIFDITGIFIIFSLSKVKAKRNKFGNIKKTNKNVLKALEEATSVKEKRRILTDALIDGGVSPEEYYEMIIKL